MSNDLDNQMDSDVLAATLQTGLQESQDLLEFLALKFEGPLAHLITVRRKGGFLSKARTVEEITLRFEDYHFQIVREPRGTVSAKILKLVRGIVLRTNVVDVDVWIRELVQELTRQAEHSVAFRSALSRFILG